VHLRYRVEARLGVPVSSVALSVLKAFKSRTQIDGGPFLRSRNPAAVSISSLPRKLCGRVVRA